MTEILWEDPKPSRRGPSAEPAWTEFLAACQEHPKRWAKWPYDVSLGSATTIAKNALRVRGLDRAEWELAGRHEGAPAGRQWVYVRYIGEAS